MIQALGGGGPDDGVAIDPAEVIARGAEGTVWSSRRLPDGSLRYWSDQRGGAFAFRARGDRPTSGHVLDTSDVLDVEIGNGQSWRVYTPTDTAGRPFIGTADRWSVLQVLNQAGAFVERGDAGTTGASDIRGREYPSAGNYTDQIGTTAAQVRQLLRRRARMQVTPIVHFVHGFGAATWRNNGGFWLAPGSAPWASGVAIMGALPAVAAAYGMTCRFVAVGWTHGVAGVRRIDYYDELQNMMASYDALDLPGTTTQALRIFLDQPNTTNSATSIIEPGLPHGSNWFRQLDFVLDHPTRAYLTGPRYPFPLIDTIHHSAYGYAKIGEVEGYVKHRVLDLGQAWEPLRIIGASITGATITVTTNQPYAGGALSIDTSMIEAAESYGFRVYVAGVKRTISGVDVSGTTITITLASAPLAGSAVELSYAVYGVAQRSGTHAGVWGNVKMAGPASPLWPAETIDAWLICDRRTLTA
ncbi:SwmB domain-containing protein [Falsiroseomonas bella]|nr:SwmB domain-containing protein [Falsiroseomonas bella]